MHFIQINDLSFQTEGSRELFNGFNIGFGSEKTALVGRNGLGKTVLVRILMGELSPTSGSVSKCGRIGYLPQHIYFNSVKTVAEFLDVHQKLQALDRIYAGKESESDYQLIGDEWDMEVRLKAVLDRVGLGRLELRRTAASLSGGELTQLMLAKVCLDEPDFLILDEPTNNLDYQSRQKLYKFIQTWRNGLLVISHDRKLLSLVDRTLELSSLGFKLYGGNYENFEIKKAEELEAIRSEFDSAKREAMKVQKEMKNKIHIKEIRDIKAHKKAKKSALSKLQRGVLKDRATRTQGNTKVKYKRILEDVKNRKSEAFKKLEIYDTLNFELPDPEVPKGEMLLELKDVSFSYSVDKEMLRSFSLEIMGPERLALEGANGSGILI